MSAFELFVIISTIITVSVTIGMIGIAQDRKFMRNERARAARVRNGDDDGYVGPIPF